MHHKEVLKKRMSDWKEYAANHLLTAKSFTLLPITSEKEYIDYIESLKELFMIQLTLIHILNSLSMQDYEYIHDEERKKINFEHNYIISSRINKYRTEIQTWVRNNPVPNQRVIDAYALASDLSDYDNEEEQIENYIEYMNAEIELRNVMI